jgi:outer membrane lipoprotein-sorting protein
MKTHCRLASLASLAALALPLFLTGCSLFPSTRKLPVPKAPTLIKTATPEELVSQLDKRWEALDSLTATVEIQATQTKTKEGIAQISPTLHGHILMRKPAMLRVFGQYLGVRVFDLASDGEEFTLSIPPQKRAIKGSNNRKNKSVNALENLRPGFFFDAMMVRGLEPNDQYSVTPETFMVEDAAKKHLISVPQYNLRITRYQAGSQKETLVRVVYFHRDDLMPYQQDIYDSEGNIETQVFYSGYQDFEGGKYPSMVIIKRPIDGIDIVLSVDDVHQNEPLKDDQFVVTPAEGATIQHLE